MPLPVRQQISYWGIATVAFLLVLWFLGDTILPFVIGMAIAYFLDPVADRLEAMGFSRTLATIVITIFAVLIFVVAALAVVPLLVDQATALVQAAPQIATQIEVFLNERFPQIAEEGSPIRRSLDNIGQTIQAQGGELLNGLLTSVSGLVNFLVILIIVPVVAFYMLMDWDRLVAEVDSLLPRDHAPTIRAIMSDIDKTLAGFIRGQGTVCLILGVFYSVALSLAGLQFGVIVGAIAGLLTFIPYVGALVGGVLAVGLALFQFWGDWLWILLIYAIFQFGQFVEGNILTPKLVGSSVGLHPVWLIFALSVFGAVFGFVGLLVAVPVAAAIGVVARWIVGRYLDSRLYKGLAGRQDIGDLDQ